MLSLSPFFHFIFFPTAMIFPSILDNLIFIPNRLDNLPPLGRGSLYIPACLRPKVDINTAGSDGLGSRDHTSPARCFTTLLFNCPVSSSSVTMGSRKKKLFFHGRANQAFPPPPLEINGRRNVCFSSKIYLSSFFLNGRPLKKYFFAAYLYRRGCRT